MVTHGASLSSQSGRELSNARKRERPARGPENGNGFRISKPSLVVGIIAVAAARLVFVWFTYDASLPNSTGSGGSKSMEAVSPSSADFDAASATTSSSLLDNWQQLHLHISLEGLQLKNAESSAQSYSWTQWLWMDTPVADPFFELEVLDSTSSTVGTLLSSFTGTPKAPQILYQSEIIPNSLSPHWNQFSINLQELCPASAIEHKRKESASLSWTLDSLLELCPLRIALWDGNQEDSTQNPISMGFVDTTVGQLLQATQQAPSTLTSVISMNPYDMAKTLTIQSTNDEEWGKLVVVNATVNDQHGEPPEKSKWIPTRQTVGTHPQFAMQTTIVGVVSRLGSGYLEWMYECWARIRDKPSTFTLTIGTQKLGWMIVLQSLVGVPLLAVIGLLLKVRALLFGLSTTTTTTTTQTIAPPAETATLPPIQKSTPFSYERKGTKDSIATIASTATSRTKPQNGSLLRTRLGLRFVEWGLSLRESDPRMQILEYFNQVSEVGASKKLELCKIHLTGTCTQDCLGRKQALQKSKRSKKFSSLFKGTSKKRQKERATLSASQVTLVDGIFDRAGVFTVWRPTSNDAIRKMMAGEAVGKGLDIKGKSAIRGKLSAFVPVVQIFEEKHKRVLRHVPKEARMRLYFGSVESRAHAQQVLDRVMEEMVQQSTEALKILRLKKVLENWGAPPLPEHVWEHALDIHYKWEITNPVITVLPQENTSSAPNRYGLELPQRVFLEAYIIRGNCHRPRGSEHDTGRPSHPSFQDMNMETLRKHFSAVTESTKGKGRGLPFRLFSKDEKEKKAQDQQQPKAVALQIATHPLDSMDPRDLVMAYEEKGRVLPVVSDFDCFLVGTRRVDFNHSLPKEQIGMMRWCVDQIEQVLDENEQADPETNLSWTSQWLDVLKRERIENDFKPNVPKYGYADPKSYGIMAHAIHHLQDNGCVRHGAECFNYYFPQDLDQEFLVISNTIRHGGNRWAKLNQQELFDFLSKEIDSGFMFPLNPKWILCDPGWKGLYDKQLKSTNPSVKQSMDAWYPPSSGIRERLESVHAKHPLGFQVREVPTSKKGPKLMEGDEAMSLALMQLECADKLAKAKKAVRAVMAANRMRRLLKATTDAAADPSSPAETEVNQQTGRSLDYGTAAAAAIAGMFDQEMDEKSLGSKQSNGAASKKNSTLMGKPAPVGSIARPRRPDPQLLEFSILNSNEKTPISTGMRPKRHRSHDPGAIRRQLTDGSNISQLTPDLSEPGDDKNAASSSKGKGNGGGRTVRRIKSLNPKSLAKNFSFKNKK